jgi:hypothetical protein
MTLLLFARLVGMEDMRHIYLNGSLVMGERGRMEVVQWLIVIVSVRRSFEHSERSFSIAWQISYCQFGT